MTLVVMLAGAACSVAPAEDVSRPLSVVSTTGMIGDVVKAVGGDDVEVHVLMGPGVDPHLYRPTRSDVMQMLRADAVFANGLDLEGKMGQAMADVRASGKPVVFVGERVEREYLIAAGDAEGAFDPHIWMDPQGWTRIVDIVRAELADLRPASASAFAQNADAYQQSLVALDDYARTSLQTVPEHQRVLITAHDAFAYFARAYNVTEVGIQGLSTDSEAGLKRIEEIVDRVAGDRIPVVFTETSVADKHIEAIIAGAQARGHAVRIGGELFSDAMGPADAYEGTYIGMIDHNVTTIVRALGGNAPARGMNGRLSTGDNTEEAGE